MATASFKRGRGNIAHNDRVKGQYHNKNIKANSEIGNLDFKGNLSLREAYEREFGEVIEKYNQKQTRADRRKTIDGYIQECSRSGKKPFEEIIFMVNPDEGETITKEQYKQIYGEYLLHFKEEYPNLAIFHASIHFDEETPHMHLDYIPTATNYKNGMEKRMSLAKGLEQAGFTVEDKNRKHNEMTVFNEKERAYCHDLLHSHGIETHKVGTHRSLTPQEYKDKVLRENALLENKISLLKENLRTVEKQVEEAKNNLETVKSEVDTELARLNTLQTDMCRLIRIRDQLADIIDSKTQGLGIVFKQQTSEYIDDVKSGIKELTRKLNNQTKKHYHDYGDR